MANHASLLDVWNAGTRLASQGLDMFTKEKQYELDTQAFKEAVGDPDNGIEGLASLQNTLALKYMDPAAGAEFRENPQLYRNYVTTELEKWKKGAMGRGNKSRYYNDKINQMYGKAYQGTLEKAEQAEIQTRDQRVNKNFEEVANIAIGQSPAGQARAAVEFQIQEAKAKNININPAEIEKMQTQALVTDFNTALKYTPAPGATKVQIDKKYEELSQDKEFAALPTFKSDLNNSWEAAVKSQQAYNFNELSEMSSGYNTARRNYETAVRTGDAGKVDAAYREMTTLYQRGSAEKKEALQGSKKSEYNFANRDQIVSMFLDPPPYVDIRALEAEEKEKAAAKAQKSAIPTLSEANAVMDSSIDSFIELFGKQGDTNSAGYNPDMGEYYAALIENLHETLRDVPQYNTSTKIYTGFNTGLMEKLKKANGMSTEATKALKDIMTIRDSDLGDITKRTGLSDLDIETDLFHMLINIAGEFGIGDDKSPETVKRLEDAMNRGRQKYIGILMGAGIGPFKKSSPLMDKDEGTSSALKNTLNHNDVSKNIYAIHENPDLITKDVQTGGDYIPNAVDDTIKATLEYEKGILTDLGINAKNISREDDDYVASVNGKKYRLEGSEDGKQMFLEEYQNDNWKTIAVRDKVADATKQKWGVEKIEEWFDVRERSMAQQKTENVRHSVGRNKITGQPDFRNGVPYTPFKGFK
jgi:hypothetical protein